MSRLKRHLEPEFRNLQAWRGKRFPGRPDDLQVRDFTHTCDLLGIPNWCPTPETPPPQLVCPIQEAIELERMRVQLNGTGCAYHGQGPSANPYHQK